MIEINNESRVLFFGHHLNQRILFNPYISDLMVLNVTTLADYHPGDSLELKPLSSMSYEDAIAIAKFYGWSENDERFEDRVLQFKIDLPCLSINGYKHRHLPFVFDYLRSKGYALPWMGLSVEQMVEAGWVKLKEVKDENS